MERFRLVTDDDCHHYLIPADKSAEWSAWRDLDGYEDPAAWTPPEWARRLRRSPECLTFTDPREE